MATPLYSYFSMSGDRFVDALTHGYFWKVNEDRTVDFSISNGFNGEFWYNPVPLANAIKTALSEFSYYANIKFNYVGYYSTPIVAATNGSEINISLSRSAYFFPSKSTWARGYFDPSISNLYEGQVGDIFLNFNSEVMSLPSYDLGSAGWFVFLHELGHVLGLKHPHDSGGTGRPTFTQLGLAKWDQDWISIMSYSDDFGWNNRQWDPATPMILDVIALQYLYGKNTTTNSGNTLFALKVNNLYQTLWDASGVDTVSAADSTVGWYIELPNEKVSTLVDTKAGIALLVSEFNLASPKTLYWLAGDMENITGGSGDDQLYGNDYDNLILGGAGNDNIEGGLGSDKIIAGIGNDRVDGGPGLDYLVFSSANNNYEIMVENTKWVIRPKAIVSTSDGVDSFYNIERLVFTNICVAVDLNANAGIVVKVLGAVFGKSSVANNSYVGIGLNLLDKGMSYDTLAGLALSTAQATTSDQIVTTLWTNVVGSAPLANDKAPFIKLLQDGFSAGALAHLAADTILNTNNINLVGLAQTGIEYIPVV